MSMVTLAQARAIADATIQWMAERHNVDAFDIVSAASPMRYSIIDAVCEFVDYVEDHHANELVMSGITEDDARDLLNAWSGKNRL